MGGNIPPMSKALALVVEKNFGNLVFPIIELEIASPGNPWIGFERLEEQEKVPRPKTLIPRHSS